MTLYSSVIPPLLFPKKFPSWPVPDLSGHYPVVGSGPGPSVHFPGHDPVFERPAKRSRITGKSSAVMLLFLWMVFQRLSDGKG